MATGGSGGNKDDINKEKNVRHSCSLCMEPFRGRRPKILPCFHTFCLPCLTALEASVTVTTPETQLNTDDNLKTAGDRNDEQVDETCEDNEKRVTTSDDVGTGNDAGTGDDVSDSQGDAGKAKFRCPTCRAYISIPKGGVASLQTNFYVDHELSEEDNSPPVLCGMCEEGDQQPATHHCQQCQMTMCHTCRRYHDKLMPKHHVTAVSTGQPVQEKEMKRYCLVHQDQVLCFYCDQCEVSICLHCKLTLHERHDTLDLASAAIQAKKDMAALITTAQQQLQVMESALQQVDHEDHQLTRHTQEMTKQVHARYDALMTWARQSRDQLLEDVSRKEASGKSQVGAEKSSMALTRDALSSALAQAASATATDPQVVMVRNELKAALLTDHRLDQHKQRADTQQRAWGWRYDVTDASVLHADDVKAYMGRVVEGENSDITTVPVSLRELADRVDRWMNEMTETTSTMTSQLASCKDDVTSLQKKENDMETKQADVEKKQADVEKKQADMEKKQAEVEKRQADLEKKAANLQTITTALSKDKTDIGRQLFHVWGTDQTATKKDKAMLFRNTDINEGGHYNAQTGIFTAEETGIFLFQARVVSCTPGVPVCAHIMVDNDAQCAVQGDCETPGSRSVLVPLDAGQTVWLKAGSEGKHYWCHTSFCGSLVQAGP